MKSTSSFIYSYYVSKVIAYNILTPDRYRSMDG